MAIPYSIEGCRHLLVAVGEMHALGFQLVRVVPHLADSPGGGRWWCWLVPATMTSTGHGATFAELPPPRKDGPFPWFPYDARWQSVPFPAPPDETAAQVLELYPQLAAQARGADEPYARWYAEMLQQTEPKGLIIGSHYADGIQPPPADVLRVVAGPGASQTVPPPPVRAIA
jgi:hypothetical protein